MLLFVLFLIGFGMKSALIPFHSWLPTAMIAPTPVSALLHAVAVVKAGVFGFARVIGFVFGPQLFHNIGAWQVLAVMAAITILTRQKAMGLGALGVAIGSIVLGLLAAAHL